MNRVGWIWVALALLVWLSVPEQAVRFARAQDEYRTLLPVVVGLPETVQVWKQHSARSVDGALVVSGEVINNLADNVFLVYVTVRGYDEMGAFVASASEHALLIHTPPGERNPFRVELPATAPPIARYDIGLTWSLQNRSEFRPLNALSAQVATTGALEVRGIIRNDEKKSMREGRVAITFYDADDNVVDAAAADVGTRRITSGSTASYIIRTGRAISYARYEIRAEGTIAPEG